ncbi:F-box protein [Aspergillus mulundensis]|uniref:F-box domain-containing protein n=1 Tax=Aspergillus mulundensis TaxID=1810919 RepID=A0A3D8T336_9EURO|nr:Uncharacterized protein DSM5745_00286 [Aspergillus mulundensis]RDW92964.1 Uncharacterized protein DSM5745_00286 [Aspergillus mulundensis]
MAALVMPPGYRSATEYHLHEEEADAIIQTTAYHRRDYCLSVIWFPPSQHVSIRSSIATPFQRTSAAGLGFLDRLPLELICETLCHLDMHSLFKLRQVNSASRRTVDSLPQYQRIVLHGLRIFCATLRTRVARDVSLHDFDTALCTKTCKLCGEFAGFMFLPSWTRCCIKCLQNAPETQMRKVSYVKKQIRLTRGEAFQLQPLYCLSGTYSMNEAAQKARIALVSLRHVVTVCRRHPKPDYPSNDELNKKFNFMASCALPYLDKETGEADRGVSCAGCQLALEKDTMGTSGRNSDYNADARDKVYSRDRFLDHFRWCDQAQLLWKSTDQGARRPPELPRFAQTGGYFRRRK